ncbi:flagellar assembly protein FliO [Donghicola sp. XS_ASV15]|uniref:flagellar assembly protein FliO n=1 Tax=Donghicola sp. XS_ASV15 TaxID=3241295 RepID=UPI003517B8E3
MDILQTQQIMTVLVFLGVLGLAWLVVQLNRTKLAQKTHAGRRLIIRETAGLGNGERALLIEAEGQSVLAILPRKGQVQMMALSHPASSEGAE